MPTRATPPQLPPAERLARLKAVVTHLLDGWRGVLRRRAYMQTLARREDLREAFGRSYAAHVQNTLQDVLVIDLVREIGALVLDNDTRSGSVAQAIAGLRDLAVLELLRAEYEVVPPPARVYRDEALDPAMRSAVTQMIRDADLDDSRKEYASLLTRLEEIEYAVLSSDVSELLRQVRNKAVAHYDMVRDGPDWRAWRVNDTGLTYGQLDEYVDRCTAAIDTLTLLVRRAAFHFDGSIEIAQKHVDEYIEALVYGLREQRRVEQEELEQLKQRAAALEADTAKRRGQ